MAFGLLCLLPLSGLASPPHRVIVRCETGVWKLGDEATGRAAPVVRGGDGVVVIRGRDGDDDWLTVDLRDSGACGALPDLRYDGGVGGWDGMSVLGDGAQEVRYEPAQSGAGCIRVGTSTIAFSNLEPIDFSGVPLHSVTLGAPASVTIQNGFDFATGTHPALRISGTSNGSPFETEAVWDVSSLVIDAPSDGDQVSAITIQSADAAANITNLQLFAYAVAVNGPVTVSGGLLFYSNTLDEYLAPKITASELRMDIGSSVILSNNAVGALYAIISPYGIYTKGSLDFVNAGSMRVDGIYAHDAVTLTVTNGTIDLSGPITTPSTLTINGPITVHGRPAGDTNGNRTVDVADVFYLINFLFAGGPAPY